MSRLVSRNRTDRKRTARRGYTLVELLVVISIIALLASLITVAVQGAMRTAKVAQVKTDMLSLEAAIASFKANYKADVPSSLTIPATPAGWGATDKAKIRRIWPRFDFTTSGGWSSSSVPVFLSGDDCLMFFLGGVISGGTPRGFSRNARTPFSTTGTNRIGPFMEFDTSRVISDGSWYVYVDPLRSAKPGYSYVRQEDYTSNNAYKQAGGGFWKPQSYQIVSPGFDGVFGDGTTSSTSPDDADNDNITNFSTGMLNP
jgi:prepilin-type N-terminal cleavage/methylation domain-containing protein